MSEDTINFNGDHERMWDDEMRTHNRNEFSDIVYGGGGFLDQVMEEKGPGAPHAFRYFVSDVLRRNGHPAYLDAVTAVLAALEAEDEDEVPLYNSLLADGIYEDQDNDGDEY